MQSKNRELDELKKDDVVLDENFEIGIVQSANNILGIFSYPVLFNSGGLRVHYRNELIKLS